MVRSLSWVAATLAVVASCLPAHAQKYPSKPVRVVVPQAAGGGLDVVVRLVGHDLS
jgi:tripartite-type tricarboxylate transporter receptor subunit TctC